MKSRTSFFNTTVLRKDITRFAPLWGLYTVFMLIALFLIWADESMPARFASNAQHIMQGMGVVNFVYAGLCAILLFGDLFQSKMAGTLHAMPMRREGWFLTHLAAGMLFCLVPNCLGALLASVILQQYCYLAFVWLGLMLCQFLFFFGAGAFSVQCAGNRLGAVAVYGLFNLLAVLVAFLVDTFYAPVLYGIETDWEAICRLSPVVNFSMSRYVAVEYNNMYETAWFEGFVGQDWQYLFVALAVGLLLLGAAVLLYRRRQMESAGDFIAVKPAAPVFLVIYTLCVGAVLYFIADQLATEAEYLFLFIGFAIGFFTGWMLLEKKVNVFQLKKWIGLGVLTLVFFLTVAITWLDPAGITRYVPDASQISSVQVSPFASVYYLENKSLVLSDAQDVQTILDVHTQLIQDGYPEEGSLCVRLRYNLRSGVSVDRRYYVDPWSEAGKTLEKYFSDFKFLTSHEIPDALMEKMEFLELYSNSTYLPNIALSWREDETAEDLASKFGNDEEWIFFAGEEGVEIAYGLLDAIYADCAAGNMAQNWEFHPDSESEAHVTVGYQYNRYSTEYMDFTVFSDCEHTLNYLKTLAKS